MSIKPNQSNLHANPRLLRDVPCWIKMTGVFGQECTKREYFAAMAMQGLHQNAAFAPNDNFDHAMIAKLSIISADALIAQLVVKDRMKITKEEMAQLDRERLEDATMLRERLRTARPDDFQVVNVGEPYPYAASLFGCYDIAVFKRKADCERFIKTFGSD